jgi:hypothetical protein
MMGRMTLREVREALAAAKARRTKASATAPSVEELKALARLLEREVKAGAPAEELRTKGAAELGAAADGGGRRGSRRAARPRGSRPR